MQRVKICQYITKEKQQLVSTIYNENKSIAAILKKKE